MVGKSNAEVQYLRLRDLPDFAIDIEDRERWLDKTNADFDSIGMVCGSFTSAACRYGQRGISCATTVVKRLGQPYSSRYDKKNEQERTLKRLANIDSLTGLANRRHFDSELGHQIKQHNRAETKMALLYIDLDAFKAVNDSLGHAAGDQVLTDVAQCLRSTLREGDVVARIGGDEFGVIVTHVKSPDAVWRLGRKLVEQIATLDVQSTQLKIGASVGALFS